MKHIMTIVFFSNILNHHQVFFTDAMYELIGDNFKFVATTLYDDENLKGGQNYRSRPYCLLAAESIENRNQALLYAGTADVCLFGACAQEYAITRAKVNPNALSLEIGERWLKKGCINIFSPAFRQWWFNYIRYYRKSNFYKLCASAFAAQDDEKLGCYKGRHFKWGYFTEVLLEQRTVIRERKEDEVIRLMWCARFIKWKHPELAIECAKRLKADGYKFQMDMFGDGLMRERIEELSIKYGLSVLSLKDSHISQFSTLCNDIVFHGNVPNEMIKQAMRESDIFLFTSDQQEGWGAVANEAMAAGCCLIASDKIGSTPYLVRNGINGFMFKDKDATSLYKIVKHVIDNSEGRIIIQNHARKDMINIWSPKNAAESILHLVNDLQSGKDTSILEGPCSKA